MMTLIRNLLAILGLVFTVLLIVLLVKFEPSYHRFKEFDEKAWDTYQDMVEKIIETGNGAEATIWKVPVADDVMVEDVEDAMRAVANEHNIKNVGELPLSKEVEAITEKPFRYLRIFMFCNPLTAANMVNHSEAFSAYLPCRITLIQDKQGKYWLYTLNMDFMIHGGEPLPAELKKEALMVKEIILDIMHRGAKGEF